MLKGTIVFLTAWAAASCNLTAAPLSDIRVAPPQVQLHGADARRGLLVEGRNAAGEWVDLTHSARYRSLSPLVRVDPSGVVYSQANGRGMIEVRVEGAKIKVPVVISGADDQRPIDFAADVLPLLSKHGCNASGCHGKAEGQNGFKLSVFAFDPVADHVALTQEGRGRRVSLAAPELSLLLTKASGAAPHGGGARIPVASHSYRTLLRWIQQGASMRSGVASPLIRLTVTPRERVVALSGLQQLRAIATYADGREEDVTAIAKFATNNPALATVNQQGLVRAGDSPGQAAIMASFRGAVDRFQLLIPRDGDFPAKTAAAEHFIDRAIQNRLHKLRIKPSGLADDATFLRRASLHIIGTLPSAKESRMFLADEDPDKRSKLVDQLLERPEYADYWALKWSDLLRVDRRALGHKNAYAYYRWLHKQFDENAPWDRLATELITAQGPLKDAPQGHFFSAVSGAGSQASALSQVFLGVRIACAECHHHPFDRWSQSDYLGISSYFTPLKRGESLRGPALFAANTPAQMKHPRTKEKVAAHPLGGEWSAEQIAVKGDHRGELAAWMTSPQNPWFARAAANRYWAHFLGRGIVEPVDDFRDTNPPSNPELLDSLAEDLITSRFDLKQLIRSITSSQAYQRSTDVNETNIRDEQNFSRRLLKRLEAEVLFDAVMKVSGAEEKFQGLPGGVRAIQLWDSETSHYFLKQFGRPQRKTACECERIAAPNVGQVLHLLNSQELADKLSHSQGRAARLNAKYSDDRQLVEELYLVMLSRPPTAQEMAAAKAYLADASQPRQRNVEDLMWALMNSIEFVFHH